MSIPDRPSQLAVLQAMFDAQSPGEPAGAEAAPLPPLAPALDRVIPGLGRFSLDTVDLAALARSVMPQEEQLEFPAMPAYLMEMKGGAARIPNDKILNPSHEVLQTVGSDLGERVVEIHVPKDYSAIETVTTFFSIHCFRERHRGGRHAAEASSTYLFASDAQLVQLRGAADSAERHRIMQDMLWVGEGQTARIGRASGKAWLPTFGPQGSKRIEGTDLFQAIVRVDSDGTLAITDTSTCGTTELVLSDKP